MRTITIKKLNKNYESDPNISEPRVKIDGNKLSLQFELNYFTFSFKEDAIGEISFEDCIMFRNGDPNDEGFMYHKTEHTGIKNNSFWNKTDFPELELHCFYEVLDSDWSSITDYGGYVNVQEMNTIVDKNNFHHYIFLMKEGTFECVAKSFKERIPL